MKFHVSPKGALPCGAKEGRCPYQHFDSFERAEEAFQHQERVQAQIQGAKEKAFETHMKNLRPEEKIEFDVNLNERGMDGAHRYIDYLQHRWEGYEPLWVDAKVRYRFDSDKGNTVYFFAQKKHKIDGATERVISSWSFTARTDTGYVIAQKDFRLMGTQEGRELKKGLSDMLDDCMQIAYSDSTRARTEKGRCVDGLLNVMYSVESLERGARRADALGFSFFKGSDKDNLIARADWGESVLTPEMIRDALTARQYERQTPRVQVHVVDSLNKTLNDNSTSWGLHTEDGKEWRLQYIEKGVSTYSKPYTDARQCALDLRDYMGKNMPEWGDRSDYAGRYVFDMISDTQENVAYHEKVSTEAREAYEKEWANHVSIINPPPKKKKGFLSKLFG